ncbi:Uncharacterised protein [BD1-7 clade bacterium]|uniref:Uncharacterized protein n=1 Tax=BD1-7 clade bacterium TaxID=2029982 RepID=A0A5S9Q8Y4_9GAMM|nr:Uncharacterised protein [BD1-7 clade bacterium]
MSKKTLFNESSFIYAVITGVAFICGVASFVLYVSPEAPYDKWFIGGAFSLVGFSIGVIALNFRSEQTYSQIQQTADQNVFSNYVDHRELFFSVLKEIQQYHAIEFDHPEQLYTVLFPNNTPTNVSFYSGNRDGEKSALLFWAQDFNNQMNDLREFMIHIPHRSTPNYDRLSRWLVEFNHLCVRSHIRFVDTQFMSGVYRKYHGDVEIFGRCPIDMHKAFYAVSNTYELLARFCIEKEAAKSLIVPSVYHGKNLDIYVSHICSGIRLRSKEGITSRCM